MLYTLCFFLKNDQVLLAMKKRGFGAGKWNGYGGKVKTGEDIVGATIREIKEESSLSVLRENLHQVAVIKFIFESGDRHECHAFISKEWTGNERETEEMRPQWFAKDALPLDEMWAGDRKWLPLILKGEKIRATILYDENGKDVKDFSYVHLH